MNLCSATTSSRLAAGFPLRNTVLTRDGCCWYAVYTWARHEKVVARQLEERGVAHFLPLHQAIHRWSKRWVRVSLPLFPGYVFVQTNAQNRHQALQVPGVVHYVGTGAAPCPIPDDEIECLRKVLLSGEKVGPHPYLSPGNSVRIASGPLAGLCGVIERTKSGSRFIISVELIKRSVAVELDGCHLAAVQLSPALGLGPAS
jgi:transcriptional antiterminator NusG